MILDAVWRLKRRFAAAARAAPPGPLSDYYAAGMADLAGPQAAMAAIDLETDGLNARADSILEFGIVGMTLSGIDLSTARRLRISPKSALRAESVVIHRITDDALATAADEAAVLADILPFLAGRVLVAHFAQIEAAFLESACWRVYGAPFVAPFICTMQLERRWFAAAQRANGLRLGHLRASYNLPQYSAHDGLIDAIACGEMLLAQLARRGDAVTRMDGLLRR
jgi:DNA polymerase III subunit epsilon